MADQVVTIPLLGGIDESVDTDQLPPPGMKELTNVVVRKKQRFQKREGYSLICTDSSNQTVPATTYDASGAIVSVPMLAEGVSGYKSAAGDKLLAAADGKLYEFVGQSSGRGYRFVNELPKALGTIVPVEASAGPATEIESCIVKDASGKRVRVTAWVVAPRPYAVLANDSYWREPVIDGSGLYIVAQDDDTGAFINPPQRILDSTGAKTKDVRNLRICEVYSSMVLGPAGGTQCVVAWQSGVGTTAVIYAVRVNEFGSIGSTQNLTTVMLVAAPTQIGLPPTVRSFDIAPVWATNATPRGFIIARCADDSVSPSDITWHQFNNVFTIVDTKTAIVDAATATKTWFRKCTRGVTLSADKFNVDGFVAVSVRMGVGDNPAAMTSIDMSIVTIAMKCTSATGTWDPYADRWAILRDMNYQTDESFTSIPGYANAGKTYPSKTVTDFNGNFEYLSGSWIGSYPAVASIQDQYRLGMYPDSLTFVTTSLDSSPTSRQVYQYQTGDQFIGAWTGNANRFVTMSTLSPYVPNGLATAYLSQWTTLTRTTHNYPANFQIPVDLTNVAQYQNNRQINVIGTPNASLTANDATAIAATGYYAGINLKTVFVPAVAVVADVTVDVIISNGILISSVGAIGATSGLVNGTYNNINVTIGTNKTGKARVVVTGGSISSITITDSGEYDTAGAGQNISFYANDLYLGSPDILNVTTVTVIRYASHIIPVDGGQYTPPAAPAYSVRYGEGNAFTGALAAAVIDTGVALIKWAVTTNKTAGYTFKDGADTSDPQNSAAFALSPQNCVHRWSPCITTQDSSTYAILAVTSCGANPYTTPNGDSPVTAAFVNSTNNYFETYKWDISLGGEALLRPRAGGAPISRGISAMAGPWRMTMDLTPVLVPSSPVSTRSGAFQSKRFVVGISPAGDESQRTQHLVYIGDANTTMTVTAPDAGLTDSTNWKYENNAGMFVESINAPRQLTIPLNSTRCFTTESSMHAGATLYSRTMEMNAGIMCDGDSENVVRIGSISYDCAPQNWRQMMSYGDYTIINGGVVSSFDGSNVNEISPMLWPQRSLVTLATPMKPETYSLDKMFVVPGEATSSKGILWPFPNAWKGSVADKLNKSGFSIPGACLRDIPRPYFMYEAGLQTLGNRYSGEPNDGSDSGWWQKISTSFGGDPKEDYQSIVVDQRLNAYGSNSSISGNTSPGGTKSVSYYGKYGRYVFASEVTLTKAFTAWVPRNESVDYSSLTSVADSTIKSSVFNNADAQGDMLMRFQYEVADSTGRVSMSAPSAPVRYSIITRLDLDPTGNVTGAWVFKYGFFAPRLELTNRLKVGSSDSRRITLQPYTTPEPYGSIFYKMPLRNWENPTSAFSSDRNSGRELCAYQYIPYTTSGAPLGLVTNNLTCFNGAAGDYMGILSMPYLYTTGGVVANNCPPAAKCMAIHRNRIVMGGADDPTVLWISKEMTEQEAPAFSDLMTIKIPDGGAITGIGSLARALVVFKSNQIHLLTGDMPENSIPGGLAASLGQPYRLVTGLGCISPRSVITTPVGVFFQSARAIELMGQDTSITPIGLRVMDIMATYSDVVSVTHKAVDSEVIFCCQKPNVLAGTNTDDDGTQFILLVYNYADDIWSKHTMSAFGVGSATIGEQDDQTLIFVGGRAYKTSDTQFYDKTTTGNVWVTMSGETAPIALNQRQGYQRVKRVVLMGDPTPAPPASQTYQLHGMLLSVMTDWDSTQVATWTEDQVNDVYNKQGREFFQVHVRDQKCQKVSIRWQDIPGTSFTTGYGVAFSNIALTVGVKAGLNKRMTLGAEH